MCNWSKRGTIHGQLITSTGLKSDSSKVTVIENLQNAKLEALLGIVNYLQTFSPN
ncbi:hypothetical protein DPMN_126960 [Dreissena polymorpha]|uniref:Uncharacterized protein n=1 Tax=Dreissena polymorpha TaxID=45954 RepID=A0A9D4H0C4_DREPO|nr:hypothetical protein DPMN_126960 [Dreissena polymorpha]